MSGFERNVRALAMLVGIYTLALGALLLADVVLEAFGVRVT